MKSALDFVHELIPSRLNVSLDATLGRGKDGLVLAKRSKLLIGFELQKEAYENSRKLLEGYNTLLYNSCHSKIAELVHAELDLAVFNLGYLPGGDKSLATRPETTKKAILACLELLVAGGKILVVAYGHDQGKEEIRMLEGLNISQKEADIFRLVHHNGANNPPQAWVFVKK